MPMLLKQLLPQAGSDLLIRELTLDSRKVLPGDLFLAVPGLLSDGRDYIAQAIKQGAAAVAYEALDAPKMQDSEALLIAVENLQPQLSALAATFYGEPSRSLEMVGVTGTNGKSTVTQLLAQATTKLGQPCAVIGTLGVGFFGDLQESTHTTPDPIAVQAGLAKLKAQGARAVAMEVSSHALDQGRVTAVEFDVAVFTNLTRDHLDYHGDMQSYAAAKAQLFHWQSLQAAVINQDDALGRQLLAEVKTAKCYSYSCEDPSATVFAKNVRFSHLGIQAEIVTPHGEGVLRSPLLGAFNLSNLLAVIATLLVQGRSLSEILQVLPLLQAPLGRMQRFGGEQQPLVVVDYAHTPDALAQVLKALRVHVSQPHQLICVVGCGGNRDTGKRPLMAQTAAKLADQVIITDDNPRLEDPAVIRQQMLAGITELTKAQEVSPRASAIAAAVQQAASGDVVLIAGKGHENYQDINGIKHPYSDLEQAQLQLAEWEVKHV